MDARVRAGIELYGTTLRYAEVERYGAKRPGRDEPDDRAPSDEKAEGAKGRGNASASYRLLRLGSCDFDFDVTRALWQHASPGTTDRQVATLRDALADVYENTAAEELRVVAHPPQACSFFAPMPAQTAPDERDAHLRREARLLWGPAEPATEGEAAGDGAAGEGDGALHVTARGLYAEQAPQGEAAHGTAEQREWFHVMAVQARTHARFGRVAKALPQSVFRWTSSTEGAAQAATALQHRRAAPMAPDAPFALSVGSYAGHLELALTRHGRFHFALHAPRARAGDSAYFAAALLERLGIAPDAVARVFVYGQSSGGEGDAHDGFAALGRLLGTEPQPLDFHPVVGLDPDRLRDFATGPYVPCIGAAL